MDKEGMRLDRRLNLVLIAAFTTLTLMVGWQIWLVVTPFQRFCSRTGGGG